MKNAEIRENFRVNAKKIRNDRKDTQTKFAETLGLTRQAYSKVEEGFSVTVEIAVKISEISGFSLDKLIKTKI